MICGVLTKRGTCGKDAFIIIRHLGRDTPACQDHYTISVIAEMEDSRMVQDSCNMCNKGFMEYRNVTFNEDTKEIRVFYKCHKCGEYESFKREIVNGTIK